MPRALVVDDSKLIRNMVCTQLHRLDFGTEQAENGQIGLELFEQRQYDLLVVDVIMPEVDGIELTRRVREINTDVPILILTSAAHPRYQENAIEAGANEYLVKPLNHELFQVAVRKMMPSLDKASTS